MCPSGATCLSVDCCFSKLVHYTIPTKRDGLVQVGLHYSSLTCSLKDIAENILSWR
jgi:hypothetical protein